MTQGKNIVREAGILDGKLVGLQLNQILATEIAARIQQGMRAPGLAVILLGDDAASQIYVNAKRRACETFGFQSFAYNLPQTTTQAELLNLIDKLNENPEVDGILVQLPLPSHMQTNTIIEAIHPKKDVDGFHPYNFGRLAQGNPTLRPCTPYGIMQLLAHYQINLTGKHTVVVGASNIVGRPTALECLLAKSTVTICHSATQNLEQHVRCADLLIVATGVPDLIDTDWLQPHQIIIDVGIHRLDNGKIRGDIDFHTAKHKVAWITPVPGGIGPMTISMLLHNTLLAAKNNES